MSRDILRDTMSRDILRGAEPPSTARDMRRDHRRGRGPACVTVAVRPAADEPLPEVYTHVGAACAELHQSCARVTWRSVWIREAVREIWADRRRSRQIVGDRGRRGEMRTFSTNLRNCDLATDGSPSSSTLMSPRRRAPSASCLREPEKSRHAIAWGDSPRLRRD